ncbi:hypothetical protein M426DRAFT_119559 [Hypoxylon sp. CI-4A]|nr:hypothetical protein M426DRAFT_119559 [Hypoxylon sp. CI-4A]
MRPGLLSAECRQTPQAYQQDRYTNVFYAVFASLVLVPILLPIINDRRHYSKVHGSRYIKRANLYLLCNMHIIPQPISQSATGYGVCMVRR